MAAGGRGRAALVALLLALVAAAPAAAQVQLPARPQAVSLDSEAPPGAPPHWLPGERWVMLHWLPYDETRLYGLLGVTRGDVWRWLRDDTRNLAGLARAKGWEPQALARALVAPWRGSLREPQRLRLLERRALRTLTQGHLSQHIFFHSLHQDAIPDNAPAIFGVASREEFQTLRRSELSPVQICRLNGLPRSHAERAAVATLTAAATQGVDGQAIPASQAQRLLRRQLRQVPRWLGQTRYNGPPPLNRPRESVATASNYSNNAVLSARGGLVAYESYEARVPSAKTRGEIGVLARTLAEPRPLRVSRPDAGTLRRTPRSAYNPAVSADGRYVAFESAEGNLNFAKRYGQMAVYVRDVRRGATRLASRAHGSIPRSDYNASISGDGRLVAYESSESLHGTVDVFVTDWRAGRSIEARAPAGQRASEPAISADGRYLAFTAAAAQGRSAVYRQDLRGGGVRLVSPAGVEAWEPSISADGTRVAFTATAGPGRSQVLLRNLATGTLRTVAPLAGADGLARDASALEPSLSADGLRVAFSTRGAGDRRGSVRVRDVVAGATQLVSRAGGAAGPPADGASGHPAISPDGRWVAFTSDAWNLSDAKCNAARGIFVRDLARDTTTLLSSGDGANRWLGAARGSSAGGEMRVALLCA